MPDIRAHAHVLLPIPRHTLCGTPSVVFTGVPRDLVRRTLSAQVTALSAQQHWQSTANLVPSKWLT